MRREHVEYKGHSINVNVDEVKRGLYRWQYTVDGRHFDEMKDRPLGSEEIVLSEGLNQAKYFVDGLEDGKG